MHFLQVSFKDPPEWVGPAGSNAASALPNLHQDTVRLLGVLSPSCRPPPLWVFAFCPHAPPHMTPRLTLQAQAASPALTLVVLSPQDRMATCPGSSSDPKVSIIM